MKRSTILAVSVAMGLTAAATAQAAELYPYPSKENYCPAGLQPVTMGGVICCGQPTTHVTYQQMMRHPVKKKVHKVRYSARAHCPEGTKGCS